jgi:hypothetical protein
MKKPISHNPLTGSTTWWHFDEASEEIGIQTEVPVQPLLDLNQKFSNEVGKKWIGDEGGLGTLVARIPLLLLQEWERTGKIHDQVYLTRWLNDSDNRKFRTHEGIL